MDFYELRAATVRSKFDDARAEKLKKIKLPQHVLSLIFHKETDLSKENMGSPNI